MIVDHDQMWYILCDRLKRCFYPHLFQRTTLCIFIKGLKLSNLSRTQHYKFWPKQFGLRTLLNSVETPCDSIWPVLLRETLVFWLFYWPTVFGLKPLQWHSITQTMLGLSLVQAQRCRHPAASKTSNSSLAGTQLPLKASNSCRVGHGKSL